MESVYERIRSLRINMNMTLKELSEKTGLSISFLSQVERGNSSLAITSLQKIANVFNVSMSSFFETTVTSSFYTPVAERKPFQIERSNSVFSRLGGNFAGKVLEPIHIVLSPQQGQDIVFNHPGEEFYYILKGTVQMMVGDKEYEMSEGDTIHFPSTLNHTWHNRTDEPVHMIAVLTPVIFHE
ncbi:putative transcriptional regulator [Desulfosporosinus orientis DSM 765]|uniref:Putative transcriptional regulator n=1 Tax=Desulfosporosinus orientis (strain ATCC 19365 / DSM 765 / NCIMB 8382 / VKM B-1628 / Singapore I) TaxID=768706 RepID=G7WE16_DESOD|nr:XRE family transcriptional regulator [Desulfosporosinus orientis]AET69414.1 putative transcriptional regulator [Desulfosporosinus orientis DSM 765]